MTLYSVGYFIFLSDGGAPKRRGDRGKLPPLNVPRVG